MLEKQRSGLEAQSRTPLADEVVMPTKPFDFTVEEVQALEEIANHLPTDMPVEELMADINSGRAHAFVYRGPKPICLVLVTEVIRHYGGPEMSVIGIAGRGYLKHFDMLWEKFTHIARSWGCHWISGMTPSPALARFYEKRLQPEVTFRGFMKEINRG